MPDIFHAELDGEPLAIQFSYEPYVPKKRRTTQETANAVVLQSAATEIVIGAGTIPWTCEAAKPEEAQLLYDKYMADPSPTYEFVGYWGDVYNVVFVDMDNVRVRSRLFNCSGMFQVIRCVQPFAPFCNNPTSGTPDVVFIR